MTAHVFVSATGQQDNIGDALLRQGMISAVRGLPGVQLHVLLSDLPDDYIAGLHLPGGDVTYKSPRRWRAALIVRSLLGQGIYGFNAGEINNAAGKEFSSRPASVARIANRFGRGSFWTGIAVRYPDLEPNEGMADGLQSFQLISWRDGPSQAFGRTGSLHPDWAFIEGSPVGEFADAADRDTISICLRGDRDLPGDSWFEALKEVASRRGLRLVLAVQVRRDAERSRVVAQRLGADILDWQQEDFAQQEARVRELYARSVAVVGDRLHAAIMGATEGAVPVGYAAGDSEKLGRTLAGAGFEGHAIDPATLDGVGGGAQALDALLDRLNEVGPTVESARERVNELVGSIAHMVDKKA